MTDTTPADEKPKRRPGWPVSGNAVGKRTSTYTEAKGKKIIEAVLDGKSIKQLVKMDGMPAIETVYKWLKTNEDFREKYAEAKFIQVTNRIDETIELADDTSLPVEDRKLMIAARQWVTQKLLPGALNHPYIAPPARTSAAELAKLIEGKEEAPADAVEPAQVIEPDDALDRELAAWRDKKP